MGHAAAPTDNVNVEFARAIVNFGSRNSLNCAKLVDDTNLGLVDDFLNIDDLEEFPDEDLAAPISNNNKNNHDNYNNYNTTCTSLTSSKSSSALCENPSHMKPLGVLSSDSLQDIIGPLCNELEPELEWLSSFNCEDSGADLELQKKESKAMVVRGFTSIPGRARSKRSGRTKARVWSYGRKPTTTKEGLTTSSTITCEKLTESDASSGSSPVLMQAERDDENPGNEQAWKKMKKGDHEEVGGGGGQAAAVGGGRRCEHCWSQKTPQWREGPGGPKTLCNACGVRYKSGRLFPEYRPAKSPTFLTSMHSNSHKKVLEMRRQQHLLLPTTSHHTQ